MITELFFENNRNNFVNDNKIFINSVTMSISKIKLDPDKDEEFKIARETFNAACDTYEESMGNFYFYAEAVIKSSAINYYKNHMDKFQFIFDTDETSKIKYEGKFKSDQFEEHTENLKRAEEIKLLKEELSIFDFTMQSVTDSCPKNIIWRNLLLNAALICSDDTDITDYIYERKHLPVKDIIDLTGISKRLLEKYKEYFIMLIILFSSDEYLYLKSYLNIKVEEKDGQ